MVTDVATVYGDFKQNNKYRSNQMSNVVTCLLHLLISMFFSTR
jgi:hypothetical protein